MAAGCAKCIIVVVNIVFTLIGLAFLGGGIFIKVGEKYYGDQLDKFQDEVPDIASGAGLMDVDEDGDDDDTLDLGGILQSMAIVFIVFGLFMTITGVLGMCGACCKKKWMLVLYIIIVGLLFLAKVAVIVLLVTKTYEDQIQDEIRDIIKKDFGGIDDFSVKSLSMNYVMLNYECCGLDGYEDFEDAENWNSNRTLTISGVTTYRTLETPIACCATNGTFPEVTILDEMCALTPTADNSNYKKGCWKEIKGDINDNKVLFMGVLGGILGFELFCIILASCILHKESREKDEDFA